MSPPGRASYDTFDDLVATAVSCVLESESFDEFLEHLRAEVVRYHALRDTPLDPDAARLLSTSLGRGIWGATPTPSNDFRPKRLPTPGRNEPCMCGSGIKYKRCCAAGPRLPPFDTAELWPFVLEELPAKERDEVIASGVVPARSLGMAADQAREQGQYKLGVKLLEPLFGPAIRGFDELHDHALLLLCDLYDLLGHYRKKLDILKRVISEAPRSPLRSGAFQRMAAMAIDRGETEEAWEAFRSAQRDDPDAPMVGILEIQLLLAEGEFDRARDRASFWRHRLQRDRSEENEKVIEFLSAIIDDPDRALASVSISASDGAGDRLIAMLRGLDELPIPAYSVEQEEIAESVEDVEAMFKERMQQMGVPSEQREAMLADLLEQLDDIESTDAMEFGDRRAYWRLVPPGDLANLEADWHSIFPLGKPFSVYPVPDAYEDLWDPDVEDRWMGFIERHPDAFDSIDILDDLVTAVEMHPAIDALGIRSALQGPMLDRALLILAKALASVGPDEAIEIPWIDTENRPVLRCIFRSYLLAEERGETAHARSLAEMLLRLNPSDNHGVRAEHMNVLLRSGENEAALELEARYGDDVNPDLPYGRALALLRLDRENEAAEAMKIAVERLPEVRRYLMRERARQPEMSEFGISLGGKDQAWIYRENMRDVWVETPGAMELLRRTKPKRPNSK